jgi:membrane protease YdiL (CAAX protease family)
VQPTDHSGAYPQFVFALLCVPAYYLYAKQHLFRLAVVASRYVPLYENVTIMDEVMVLEMVFVALSHVVFVLCIGFLIGFDPRSLVLDPSLASAYLLLVSGLLGAGAMLATATIARFVTAIIEDTNPQLRKTHWALVARSGWLRHHLVTLKLLPFPVGLLLSSIQVGCEEIYFRGILLGAFAQSLGWIAVAASSIAFIVMQAFHMPSALHAMFPIVGASVMVFVFVPLFYLTGSITPCIVAHLAFFFSSLLMNDSSEG